MAAHVNGVHDVVQEEHPAVDTAICPDLLALCGQHLKALSGHSHAQLHARRTECLEVPLLLLLHQRQASIPHTWGHVIGQIDEASRSSSRRWSPSPDSCPLLVVAFRVSGVLAAGARRAVLFAGCRFGLGQQQEVLSSAVFSRQAVALDCLRLVQVVDGADHHVCARAGWGLDQRPQGLSPQVAYGAVDCLVYHMRLHHLP
ncbi:hypothetical protein MHYP_G00039140 [Metynnis hypsauchen]